MRGGPRMPHRVRCRVRWHDPDSGQPRSLLGQTVNISASGLAVQLGDDVPTGARVEALVPHLNDEPMFVYGNVVHSRRVLADTFEIGIHFAGDFQAGAC